jgi:hypothetical protein
MDDEDSTWTVAGGKTVVEVNKDEHDGYMATFTGVKEGAEDDVTLEWKEEYDEHKSFDDNRSIYWGAVKLAVTDLFLIRELSSNPSVILTGGDVDLGVSVVNGATKKEISFTATASVSNGNSDIEWAVSSDNDLNTRLYTDITKTDDDPLVGDEEAVTVSINDKLKKGTTINLTITANRYGKDKNVVNSKTYDKTLTVVEKTADDFYVVPTVTIIRGGETYNPLYNSTNKDTFNLELAENGLNGAKITYDVYEKLNRTKFATSTGVRVTSDPDDEEEKKAIEHAEEFEYLKKVTPESFTYEAKKTDITPTDSALITVSGTSNEATVTPVAVKGYVDVVATIVVDGVKLTRSVRFYVQNNIAKQNVQLVLSDLSQTYKFDKKGSPEGTLDGELVIPVGLKAAYLDKIIGDGDGVISTTPQKNEDKLFSLVEAKWNGIQDGGAYEYRSGEKYKLTDRTDDKELDSLVGYRFLNQTAGAKFQLPTMDDLDIASNFTSDWDPKRVLIAFTDGTKCYAPGEQIEVNEDIEGSNSYQSKLYAIWMDRYFLQGIYRGDGTETEADVETALGAFTTETYQGAKFQVAPAFSKVVFDDKAAHGYKYELAADATTTWTAYDTSAISLGTLTALDANDVKKGILNVVGTQNFTVYPTVTAEGLTYDLGKNSDGSAIGVAFTVSTTPPSYRLNLDAFPDTLEAGQEIAEIDGTPIAVGIKKIVNNTEQDITSAALAKDGKLTWTSTSDLIDVEMGPASHENEAILTAAAVSADTDVTLKLVYEDQDGFSQEITKTIKVKKAKVALKFYTDDTAATETTSFEASATSKVVLGETVNAGKGTFFVKAVSDESTAGGIWSVEVADADQYANAPTPGKKLATVKFGGDVAGSLSNSSFKSVGKAGVYSVDVVPEYYRFDADEDESDDVLLGNTILLVKYTLGDVTYVAPVTMNTYLPITLYTKGEAGTSSFTSKEVAIFMDDTDVSIVDNDKVVTGEIKVYAGDIAEKTQKVSKDLSAYKVVYYGEDPIEFKGWADEAADETLITKYVGEAESDMDVFAHYGATGITAINPNTRVIKLDNTTKAAGKTYLPVVAIKATVEPGEVETPVRIAPENGDFFKMVSAASDPGDVELADVASIQGVDMDKYYDPAKHIRTDTVYVQAIPEKAGKTVLHLIAMDDTAVENTITLSVSGFNKDKEGNETYFKPDGEQAKGEVITIDGIDHYYDLETGFRVTDGKCVLKEGTVLLKGNIKQTGLIEITEDNGDKNTYWVDPATGLVTGGVIADVKDGSGAVIARYVIDKDGKLMKPEKIATGESYAILTAVDGKTYLADKDGKILTKAEFDKIAAGVVIVGGEEYVVEDGDVCAPAKAYYYDSYKDVTWKFNAGAPTVDVTLVYKADDGATKEDVRTNVPATTTDGAEVTMKKYTATIEAKYPIKGQTTKAKIELTKMYDKDGNSKEYKLKGKVKFNWAKTIEEGATKPVVTATVTYSVTEEGKSLADETFKDQPAIVDDGVPSKDEKSKEFTASYTTLDGQTATEKKSYNVNKGKIEPESTDPADTSEAEGLTYNLFYENEGIEVKLGDLTVDTTAFASTSPKASQYYEIVDPSNETTGSFTVKVKATGADRAKAATAANSKIMVPTADGGVFEYSLPVAYKKPQLKKSVASGKINKNVQDPQKVTVTLSELKTTGAYEEIDLSEQQENVALYSGNGFSASSENISVDGGTLSITTTSKVTGGKIHVQLNGWTAPVDVAFNITAVAKNVITVDKAKVFMNTTKKELTSQTVKVLVNGEEPTEDQGLTLVPPNNASKGGFTAELEGDTVIVSYPENAANMKAGTYNFKLKTSDGGQGKLSVVVSKKELANAVTLKTNIKYNVVTKQAMVITPTLNAVSGEIEEVTTNDGEVFTAEYNAEKNQIVLTPSDEDKEKTISYKTQYNPTLNFKMTDGEEFAINTLKFKPVKTLPTVKIDRIKVVKGKAANGTSRVTSYYLQKGKKIAIAPAKVEIIGNKVAAVSGEENKWQHSDSGAIFTVEQDEDGKILVKMTGPVADDGTVGALTKKPSGVKVQTTFAAGADTVVRKTALNVTLSAR